MILRTVLTQADEQTAPPEQPVLEVARDGDQVFLTISVYDEDGEACSYRPVAHCSVSLIELAHALRAPEAPTV